jgi:hypothetical protein
MSVIAIINCWLNIVCLPKSEPPFTISRPLPQNRKAWKRTFISWVSRSSSEGLGVGLRLNRRMLRNLPKFSISAHNISQRFLI